MLPSLGELEIRQVPEFCLLLSLRSKDKRVEIILSIRAFDRRGSSIGETSSFGLRHQAYTGCTRVLGSQNKRIFCDNDLAESLSEGRVVAFMEVASAKVAARVPAVM